MQTRRDLQRRYPEFQTDPKLAKLFQQAIDADRAQVAGLDARIEPAELTSVAPLNRGLSLTANTRLARTSPANRMVYVQTGDVMQGVDIGNGDPVWKRVVGSDPPFFPVEVAQGIEGVVVYNTVREQLECLNRDTGELLWRQPKIGRVSGPPLLLESQAYFATRTGELHQVDLETGSILLRLKFSQPLASTPALVGERDQLLVVGEREVVYLLNLRPFEIRSVIPIAHQRGAIAAPPLRMGPLVLLAVNDRTSSCELRVFDTRDEKNPLVQIAEARLNGVVLDPPAIRGQQLVVPSSPERLTAFTVSAETGQPALSLVAETQVAGAEPTSAWRNRSRRTNLDGEQRGPKTRTHHRYAGDRFELYRGRQYRGPAAANARRSTVRRPSNRRLVVDSILSPA